MTKNTLLANIEDMVHYVDKGRSPNARAWLSDANIDVYIRVGKHVLDGALTSTIDIGNLAVNKHRRGAGHFTAFLGHLETLCNTKKRVLYMENVMDPRFQAFFEKRGYVRIMDSCDLVPSYYRNLPIAEPVK